MAETVWTRGHRQLAAHDLHVHSLRPRAHSLTPHILRPAPPTTHSVHPIAHVPQPFSPHSPGGGGGGVRVLTRTWNLKTVRNAVLTFFDWQAFRCRPPNKPLGCSPSLGPGHRLGSWPCPGGLWQQDGSRLWQKPWPGCVVGMRPGDMVKWMVARAKSTVGKGNVVQLN